GGTSLRDVVSYAPSLPDGRLLRLIGLGFAREASADLPREAHLSEMWSATLRVCLMADFYALAQPKTALIA
ncbi:MAG: hypothetical protein ACTTHL_07615, partial [Oribacterium sp.]